jgi:hypothetical protein
MRFFEPIVAHAPDRENAPGSALGVFVFSRSRMQLESPDIALARVRGDMLGRIA